MFYRSFVDEMLIEIGKLEFFFIRFADEMAPVGQT
jgi:hypothetical protein